MQKINGSKLRLEQQIRFVLEIDKLKTVLRQSPITSGKRRENSAEHSWHVAMMAMLMVEHANDQNLDFAKVMKMLLIHDIVEIDAGHTFIYDEEGLKEKHKKELQAADRIFKILPEDQATEYKDLWLEYEAQETPESHFAASIDRLQPVLLNAKSQGGPWIDHRVTYKKVRKVNDKIAKGSTGLWQKAVEVIDEVFGVNSV